MSYYHLPYVFERDGRSERTWDIYSRLLKDRIIFIGTPIDDYIANAVVAQLLLLQMEDPKKDVSLYINSCGGQITAGLAILDTMQFLGVDVNTYCIGQAVSMASLLLAGGTKGKRYSLPNSRIMIHQPFGGVMGTSEDIALQAKEILELKKMTASLMSQYTGQPLEKVIEDSERDFYMSPEAALKYGIIDHIAKPSQLNSSTPAQAIPATV